MRVSLPALLLILVIVIGAYRYQTTASICPAPIHYRIGDIDESFSLSHDEAKQYVKTAELVWEDSVNRDLFIYDEEADFTVDFIFDERQQQANEEEVLRDDLDKKLAENESILQTVEKLQSDYEELDNDYKNELSSYESRLKEYNAKVSKYNDRGGAPVDVFEELAAEKESLEKEEKELSALANNLNSLVNNINELSDRGNQLINTYNEEVEKYNGEFGYSREFTQGDHQGNQIRIYKFSDKAELITVLSHEFGHALGLGHVEEAPSLMYYLLQDESESPILSAEDINMYYEVCGQEESLEQKIRKVVRGFLSSL